jgi:hypothetical protein
MRQPDTPDVGRIDGPRLDFQGLRGLLRLPLGQARNENVHRPINTIHGRIENDFFY